MVVIAVIAFTRTSSAPVDTVQPQSIAPVEGLRGPYPVTRVVDGDTIHVQTPNGDVTVRLIGIDTPETVAPNRPVECFGPEAAAEARRLMEGGRVYLELDSSQDSTDRYGRTLAYVWRSPTELVNLDLIAGGFAEEYLYRSPYHHYEAFVAAETAAVSMRRGMWSACG